jgi:hypothetical protein
VTGVQTCALPISGVATFGAAAGAVPSAQATPHIAATTSAAKIGLHTNCFISKLLSFVTNILLLSKAFIQMLFSRRGTQKADYYSNNNGNWQGNYQRVNDGPVGVVGQNAGLAARK